MFFLVANLFVNFVIIIFFSYISVLTVFLISNYFHFTFGFISILIYIFSITLYRNNLDNKIFLTLFLTLSYFQIGNKKKLRFFINSLFFVKKKIIVTIFLKNFYVPYLNFFYGHNFSLNFSLFFFQDFFLFLKNGQK
jgi:hypothetical protein